MPGRVQASEPSGPHQYAGNWMVNPRTAMPSVRLQVDAKFTAPTWAAEATRRRVRIDWTAAADLRPLPTRLTSRGARRAAAWIRRRSRQLREECGAAGVPYVDVGELGFETAMRQARACCLGAAESPGTRVVKSTPYSKPAASRSCWQRPRRAAHCGCPMVTCRTSGRPLSGWSLAAGPLGAATRRPGTARTPGRYPHSG